jgi:hypothetical protein
MRQTLPPELEASVELARSRGGESGERRTLSLDAPRSAVFASIRYPRSTATRAAVVWPSWHDVQQRNRAEGSWRA